MAPLNVEAKVALLREKANQLGFDSADRHFFFSLLDWYQQHGFWTLKQEAAVDRFLAKFKESAEAFSETQIEKVSALFFDGNKLRRLFDLASTKIKYPSIHFWRDIGELKFYLCGAQSSTPGFIRITNAQSYPNQEVYAEINKDGKGLFRKDTRQSFKEEILRIADSPIEEAKLRGIKTGYCCFCSTPIQTKESLEAGYGPICAGNYGLPWGTKAVATSKTDKLQEF